MAVNSINPYAANAQTASESVTVLPAKTLTQQDFLKLLVAQMSAQDPMNPQSNADFAAQMAQFTALETSQTTDAKISQLLVDEQVQQASGLIGRGVTVLNANGAVTSGTVSSVQLTDNGPALVVNGIQYGLNQVISIQPPTAVSGTH